MQEFAGFMAGALTTVAFIPQIWRLFRLKSAREISLPFTLLLACGVSCWLVYGILFGLAPVILWNAVTLCLALTMLYEKVRYGGKKGGRSASS